MWWSRPSVPCDAGRAAELGGEDHDRVVSSPRCLRSLSRPAIGLSTALTVASWFAFKPPWASQTPAPPAPCWTWMKRTPRSTAAGPPASAMPKSRVAGSIEAVELLRRLRFRR